MLRAGDLNLAPLNVADGQVVLAAQPRKRRACVWIEGLPRKRDGELTGIDAARLTAAATAAAGLSERLGRPLT